MVEIILGDIMHGDEPERCGPPKPRVPIIAEPLPKDFQKHYDEAVNTLRNAGRPVGPFNPATYYAASEKSVFYHGDEVVSEENGACHYDLALTSDSRLSTSKYDMDWKPIILASNFNFQLKYEEQSLAFWEWITGDESPWRSLMTAGKPSVITDKNDKMIGYSWTAQQLKTGNFRLFKNFCIAARQVQESSNNIRLWYSLVKIGVDPNDAFLAASYFTESEDGQIYSNNTKFLGDHWPVTLSGHGAFSYQSWISGSINKGSKRINDFFAKHDSFKSTDDVGKLLDFCKSDITQTGMFTRTIVFTHQKIKDGIEKYLETLY